MKRMRVIDIGVNLTDEMFRGVYRSQRKHVDDFVEVIERAKRSGVVGMLSTGTCLETSVTSLKLCQQFPNNILTTVGVHPTSSNLFEEKGGDAYLDELRLLIEQNLPHVAAVGECGIDYDRLHFCPKDVQLKWFKKQFDLAEATQLPMFLHSRNTGDDFVNLMKENRARISGGVVHSFTGSMEEMQQLIDLDLFIGINGCSLKTAENLEVARNVPLDKLVIETDAPWCEIRPTHAGFKEIKTKFPTVNKPERYAPGSCVRGRNEPCHLTQVIEVLASIRGLSVDELATVTLENTLRAFPKFALLSLA